jgi:hypothetical protein
MFNKNHGAFIVRLHEALDALHAEGKESIACWEPDGKSFTVNDRTGFIDDVVSAYFDSMTYSTFEQRVRGWGFGRSPMYYTEGKATYFHPAFVRGKIPNIVRTTTQMKVRSAFHSPASDFKALNLTSIYYCLSRRNQLGSITVSL